jgi:hypothetical protein
VQVDPRPSPSSPVSFVAASSRDSNAISISRRRGDAWRHTVVAMDAKDVERAKRQYRDWVVVDVLDVPVADGQLMLRIESTDGSQETLITSNIALLGLDEEDDEGSEE